MTIGITYTSKKINLQYPWFSRSIYLSGNTSPKGTNNNVRLLMGGGAKIR